MIKIKNQISQIRSIARYKSKSQKIEHKFEMNTQLFLKFNKYICDQISIFEKYL